MRSWMCFRIRTVTRVITKSNSNPGDLQHNDIVEGPCTKGSMCPSIVLTCALKNMCRTPCKANAYTYGYVDNRTNPWLATPKPQTPT